MTFALNRVHNNGKGLIQVEENCSKATVSLQYGAEWQYGGEYASVKSLLRESKSSGKLTWRGSRKGAAKQSERSELSKKQHLPQAIHALIKQGLPEQEAVRQVDELLLKFGITMIRAKFDAFLWRQQMKSPKKGVEPAKKGAHKLSTKDPEATVKAFDEAYERLLQAATFHTVAQKLNDV